MYTLIKRFNSAGCVEDLENRRIKVYNFRWRINFILF